MNRGKCANRNISRAGGRRGRGLAPSCLPVRRLLARRAQAGTQTGREREVKPNIPQAVRYLIQEDLGPGLRNCGTRIREGSVRGGADEQPPVDEEEGHAGEQAAEEAREGLLADAILSLQADPEGRQGHARERDRPAEDRRRVQPPARDGGELAHLGNIDMSSASFQGPLGNRAGRHAL